jgi:hypothetical protein
VYERLKHYGQSEAMFEGPPVLYDARLKHTSAWANTYLDRDHFSPQRTQEQAGQASGEKQEAKP